MYINEWDLAENIWVKDEIERYRKKYSRMDLSDISEMTMAVFLANQYAKYNTCFYLDVCEKSEKADCTQCIEKCMNDLAQEIWPIYENFEDYAEKMIKELSRIMYEHKITKEKDEAYKVFEAWIIKGYMESQNDVEVINPDEKSQSM